MNMMPINDEAQRRRKFAELQRQKSFNLSVNDRLESEIAAECIEALERGGWLVRRIENRKRMKKGFSDSVAIKGGRVVFIEFKTAKGKQRPEQVEFQRDVEAHGGEYRIVRCLDDIVDLFKRA